MTRLASLINGWPSNFKPSGQILTAVDASEILPPFTQSSEQISCMILLFSDCVAFVQRSKTTSWKAQVLLSKIDKPASMYGAVIKLEPPDLHFIGWTLLANAGVSISDNNSAIWITLTKELRDAWDPRMNHIGLRKFWLNSAWERKADDLAEEFTKVMIASKSSKIRELRWKGERGAKARQLELWTAIYELEEYEKEKIPARSLIRLGPMSGKMENESKTVEIVTNIEKLSPGKIR